MRNIVSFSSLSRFDSLSVGSAAIAIALGIACSLPPSTAHAQSTSSTIFGQAPAGETITATSSLGLHRHETVNKKGRYKISSLPTGDYTVTLEKSGQSVDTRSNIALIAGRGAEVDFACPNDHCAASENN
ncbi:carboxypeptidase-like regulatory domain-containing protein [Dyella choica]|uniref:Carboxypeptidase regulatory-like domain-containing protein n=1 Tax=Dyella choica TaxID=1927959 RepID=A0A3S0S6P9_9GAMM|nr:carboxypeptidase-like regulatory domain-containing protein [Dyella choica]RUL69210.1 carboxypeptidase regulatory-like domain-containing protein [Dyella choica]